MRIDSLVALCVGTLFRLCDSSQRQKRPLTPDGGRDRFRGPLLTLEQHDVFDSGLDSVSSVQPPGANSYCTCLSTCHECVTSYLAECEWTHELGCVHSDLEPSSARRECPVLTNDGPVLVPEGVRRYLKLQLQATDPTLYGKEIICQIKLRERLTHLKGRIWNDAAYCYPVTLSASEPETGSVSVVWGGAAPHSNELPLAVYRCEWLGGDCESCRALPPLYACGWCRRLHSCVLSQLCRDHLREWTLNRLTCDPRARELYYV